MIHDALVKIDLGAVKVNIKTGYRRISVGSNLVSHIGHPDLLGRTAPEFGSGRARPIDFAFNSPVRAGAKNDLSARIRLYSGWELARF